ncbi:hypothetical protein [Chryseobacterium proteolyticum]|uniref:hypothetical protein n=1 Tax=Chryseobacterium proteolyticum TaxID=118127 RepID=UPI00398329AE
MKRVLFIIFFWTCIFGYSQSKIKVIDEIDKTPVLNAKIFCNDKLLGQTDSRGIFEFKTKCNSIEIRADYYQNEIALVEENMEVSLLKTSSKTTAIETVILQDKSDPSALEILNKVNKYFKENSPKSLSSYTYKSYEKVSLDIDEDSITQFNQFFNDTNFFKKKREKDSLNNISAKKNLFKKQTFSLGKSSGVFVFKKIWRKDQYFR